MAGSSHRGGAEFGFSENAEINVTPFIDVLLVLLVIFMIAVPLSTTSVPLDLPVSTATPPKPQTKPIELSIGKDGQFYIGDQRVKGDLAQAMKAAGATSDSRILLRADKATAYSALMALLDQVRAAGYTRLALVGQADAG